MMATPAERIAHLEAVTSNLVGWQEKQNGAIQRLREKLDRLMMVAGTGLLLVIGNRIVSLVK